VSHGACRRATAAGGFKTVSNKTNNQEFLELMDFLAMMDIDLDTIKNAGHKFDCLRFVDMM